MPTPLRALTGHNSPNAFVTLVTNADYALGAKALMRSIALSGTKADRVVLHTPAVDKADLRVLEQSGVRLIEAGHLDTSDGFNQRHSRKAQHAAAPFTKGEKPAFHSPLDNFIKLRLWQLTEYERIVFIDADALMLQNCDRLFDYPEFSAAPNVYESLSDFHRLNSGVFVAKPSKATFHAMMEKLDVPDMFWTRTDQTFLQSYFPDWHGLPVFYNMLQYVWFNLPELWNWDQIKILHYQYEKPWQDPHPKEKLLSPLNDLWKAYAGDGVTPTREDLPVPPAPMPS